MKQKKIGKRIFCWVVGVITIITIGMLFWSYRLTYAALHPPRDTATYESMGDYYPQIDVWLDSVLTVNALRDTVVINDKNEQLHALWIAAAEPTKRTAVIFHGYQGSALSMLMIGYMFNHDLGFNVLLPDLRGHGDSDTGVINMGWKEQDEMVHWVEIADKIFGGNTQIVLHGISMGGATTMIVASNPNLPANVLCAIEDCGYTSVWDAFSVAWDEDLEALKFPLLDMGNMWSRVLYGWSFKEASPLNAIGTCELPMLFIHGEEDSLLPVEMVYELYAAKPGEKELWILPGVDHGAAYHAHPNEYSKRVKTYVEKYFN